MNPTILAPGPTKVHPELMQWLRDADVEGVYWRSHRSPWFEEMFAEVKNGLRELLGIPADYTIAFSTSANEVWERSIESLVEKESFHVVGGEFGNRWFQYAKRLRRSPSSWKHDHLYSGHFDDLEVPESAEVICVTQNETGTGFWIPEDQIDTLASRYPDKLMLVDVVSSIPHVDLKWERTDLAYWSIQKGFNLPAGLGVVVISPRAVARCNELSQKSTVGAYHAFSHLAANSERNHTAETPNVLGIYLLKRAISKYLEIGIDQLRAETIAKAERAYAALPETSFSALVATKAYRSPCLIAITRSEPVAELRAKLAKDHNVHVGACYDELKVNSLRLANFPIHTWEELETGLKLLK